MKMIGLFEEARSHDRADLLPLRVIASMANQASASCGTPDRFATLVMASVASACPKRFPIMLNHCHRAAGGAHARRGAFDPGQRCSSVTMPRHRALLRPEIVAVPMIQPDRKAR